MIALIAASLAGCVLWTFMEYVLHRFAFHESPVRWYGSREHLRHHAARDMVWGLSTFLSWSGVIVVSFLVLTPLGTALWSSAVGLALGTGYCVGFFTYEFLHFRAHVAPPRTAYGRWLRHSHFHHHFVSPLGNHGVTTPIWDHVFGTNEALGTVPVPRRMAPRWLLGSDGEVLPAFAADYLARGRRDASGELVADDTRRAFSNIAPQSG